MFRAEALESALTRLLGQGRIEAHDRDGATFYSSRELFIPLDASVGWEAAVYDHFHALVRTICSKVAGSAKDQELVGGSTYSFAVWPGHPYEEQALGTLKRFRTEQSALRAKVDAHNAQSGIPEKHRMLVTYAGQHVVDVGEEDDATRSRSHEAVVLELRDRDRRVRGKRLREEPGPEHGQQRNPLLAALQR